MANMSFTNNAATTLASGISAVATSLTVATGTGIIFPTLAGSQYFYCTLENTAGTLREIVKVTARSTDTFTIVRAQDNTTVQSWSTGDKVELRIIAAELNNFPKLDEVNTFSQAQTFSVNPVMSGLTASVPVFTDGSKNLTSSGTVPTGQGGTGLTTFTAANNAIYSTSSSALTAGTLPLAAGGTNATSSPAAMASLISFTTTATAAGTTTLTNASTYYQLFTGTTTQTIVLPVTSTLAQGWSFHICNNSTGNLTVNSSGANLVCTVLPQTTAMVTCILTSGTTAASWEYGFTDYSETASVQFGSFGVGTASSGTSGEIRATNNVTAFYSSDSRLKENIRDIPNALDKVSAIGGKLFDWTDTYIQQHGGEDGYFVRKSDFGVIAQDVQPVLPEAVHTREDGTLAVDYEKLCALAFAAIVELRKEVKELKAK